MPAFGCLPSRGQRWADPQGNMWEVAHLEPRMNVFCGINTHWLEQGRFLADVSELYDGSRWRDIGHVQLVSGTMVYSERVPRGQPA